MAVDLTQVANVDTQPGELPTTQPKPFFALLDRTLSIEIRKHVPRAFWIDTVVQ